MDIPKSILITGASSGIGGALALAYAAPGVTLALGGRDLGRLGETAAATRESGAQVFTHAMDVTDRAGMARWVELADSNAPLDLVIANAGISTRTRKDLDLEDQTREIMAVNVDGVLNTVHPALRAMRPRRSGQIAIVSSIAGYRGLPSSPAYSTSKVAVKAYGETLRGIYHDEGIGISVVCPGYVRTPMTAHNEFKMPFVIDADKAARIIIRGLARNRARIAFPWQMVLVARFLLLLPERWADPLLRRTPRK